MYLKENIRFIRKEHLQQTQEKFAETFGVTRQTISQYEGGYAQPDIEFLLKLEEISGVPFRKICLKKLRAEDFAIVLSTSNEDRLVKWNEEPGEYKVELEGRVKKLESLLKKLHPEYF